MIQPFPIPVSQYPIIPLIFINVLVLANINIPTLSFNTLLFPSSSITLPVFSSWAYGSWKLFVAALIPFSTHKTMEFSPPRVTLSFGPSFLSLVLFVSPLARFKGHSLGIVSAALPLIFKRLWVFVELLWAKPHPIFLSIFLSLVPLSLFLSLSNTIISPGPGPSWPVTHIDWPCRRSLWRMRDGTRQRVRKWERQRERDRERETDRQTAGPKGCKAQGQK